MSLEDWYVELKKRRKSATSQLTWNEFHAAVVDYVPAFGNGYWIMLMQSYRLDGTWIDSQYNLAKCDPGLTIDDFRVHYTARVHWMWFHRRAHSEYTVVWITRARGTDTTPILVFRKFGERFAQCDSLLKDVVAMHKTKTPSNSSSDSE